MPSVATPSKAGIVADTSGDRHIPESTRADGSTRKQIKIRPGYKPPEDVEVYKNRTADGFRKIGTGGVPGADGLKGNDVASLTSNKNAKRREARKKAKALDEADEESAAISSNKDNPSDKQTQDVATGTEELDPELEKERKARNLKKKLKQARELKEKKDGGSALLPEQFAKVIKINELIRELDALGFDAEGEMKDTGGQ